MEIFDYYIHSDELMSTEYEMTPEELEELYLEYYSTEG